MEVSKNRGFQKIRNRACYIGLVGITIFIFVHLRQFHIISTLEAFKYIFLVSFFHMLFASGLYNVRRNKKRAYTFAQICYGIAFVFTGISFFLLPHGNGYAFWMLGGWILSILLHYHLGCIYQTFFCILYGMVLHCDMNTFSYMLLMSVGMCLLVPYMKKISNIGYIVLTGLFSNATLYILTVNFQIFRILALHFLWVELAVFVTLMGAVMVAWLLQGYFATGDFSFIDRGLFYFFDTEMGYAEETQEQFHKEQKKQPEYEKYLTEAYPLYLQFKTKNQAVFWHCNRVAEFAKAGAQVIAGNVSLAYSGALYHEVGKINPSANYVEQGIKIGAEYGLPNEILEVIAEHNLAYGKPTSKEAALVMLADSVVSMLEQLSQDIDFEEKIQLVHKVFMHRVEHEALSKCDLTMQEYYLVLQQFEKLA